jgi:hypothetical protein
VDAGEYAPVVAGAELVQVAAPTAYAREVIVAARRSGRQVAIVSNNSEPAIVAYRAGGCGGSAHDASHPGLRPILVW